MPNRLGRAAVMLIGVAQWIYAFILSVCVGMANNDESPNLRISFHTGADTTRTILLLLLILLSWCGAFAFVGKFRWAWFYTWILGLFLLAAGLYSYWTNGGPVEAIVGDESLLHGTSGVLAASAVVVLVLLNLPATRRLFSAADRAQSREN
jgi:hypothetical protein